MIGFHVDKIETVIFDIGGVLLNIDHDAFPRLLGIERVELAMLISRRSSE